MPVDRQILVADASATVAAAWSEAPSEKAMQRQMAAVTAAATLYADVGAQIRAHGVSIKGLAQARNPLKGMSVVLAMQEPSLWAPNLPVSAPSTSYARDVTMRVKIVDARLTAWLAINRR